jgi:glycosylphosphatidylinositol deacylase
MRRRSTGSATEEEGDTPTTKSHAEITSGGPGGRGAEATSTTKDLSDTLQITSRQAISQNSAHELDRRKSTDQRPSTARSRLPSTSNWKIIESRDGQIDKKKLMESALTSVPSKEAIPANNKMSQSRSRSQNNRRSRLRSPWSCSLLTFVTTTIASISLFAIIHSFANRQQDNKGCRMSYMRPSFAKLSDFDTEHTRFASKYSVYLYREGGVDEDTKVWKECTLKWKY